MSSYYTAQICLNGHEISCRSNDAEKFCTKCGSEAITSCPTCTASIRGKRNDPGIIDCTPYIVPSYCYNCGQPYPWTQSSLDAIKELIEFDEMLSNEEKTYMSENLPNLPIDTPKTKVVATKFGVFLRKAGAATGNALRDILVDIVSEAAKKIIFP